MAENPEVEAVPVIYKAEEVTPPKYEDCDPSTGMSLSVLKTGIEPSNVIPQPLPEALNPVEVDANKSATGEGEKTGTVTQAGGGS